MGSRGEEPLKYAFPTLRCRRNGPRTTSPGRDADRSPCGHMSSPNESGERILDLDIATELKQSYLRYAMSVIVDRALPDVRDGLKPSQRRILVAMNDLGLTPQRKTLKCAKVVGETMGNYHPHGDQAIYPTLVRMGQSFNMRQPTDSAAGQLRLHRRRPACVDAVHRMPHDACRCRDAPGPRQGHGRLPAELRRVAPGADRPAGHVPEPPRQRRCGYRRGHGVVHALAQPERGGERDHRVPPQPGHRAPGADGTHPRPGLPDRWTDLRQEGDLRRVLHGARHPRDARQVRDHRARQGPRVDHRPRDPVSGEQGDASEEDRRGGQERPHHGHRRHPRRVRPPHPPRDPPEEGRGPRDRPQPALPVHAAQGVVQRHHDRAGRRAPGALQPQAPDRGVRQTPHHRHHAAHAVPPPQGRGARPHRRGPPQGTRPDRRDRRADPRVRGPEGSPRPGSSSASTSRPCRRKPSCRCACSA